MKRHRQSPLLQRAGLLGSCIVVLFVCGMVRLTAASSHAGQAIRLFSLPEAPRRLPTVRPPRTIVDPRTIELAARVRDYAAAQGRAVQTQLGTASLTREQRTAWRQLQARLATPTVLRMRSRTGTPRWIKGARLEPAAPGMTPGTVRDEATARAFLRANRVLLRLTDTTDELRLRRRWVDRLGRRHLRFAQTYDGLPVWPASLTVHLDPHGHVDLMNGASVATPSAVNTTPQLDATTAIARARASIPDGDKAVVADPVLIIYAPGAQPARLAWQVELAVSIRSHWMVVIDAVDGATLTAYNQVMEGNVAGSGVGLFGDVRPLDVWQGDSSFFLVDTSKLMFDPTSHPPSADMTRGGIIIQDAQNRPATDQPETLPELFQVTSDNITTGWLPDGVSAAFNLSETYDYFLDRHARNSLDDQGSSLRAIVRLGQDFQNAFFNAALQVMVFGDGIPLAGTLDIVAHELTHGVTDRTARLIYQNQSGALNESFSDIFGEMTEARTTGGADWLVGSRLPQPLRDMADPSSLEICSGCGRNYPSTMSGFIQPDDPFLEKFVDRDNGGVHINSSIINHAFYLLAAGLDGAIGLGDAERIFYRALTTHLFQSSQFIDARLACIQAAEELFGADSNQASKTAEAFDAVEIFDATGTPEPPPVPAVDGLDATLFVFFDPLTRRTFLGRREEALEDGPFGVPLGSLDVIASRPAVSGDGSWAAFVDAAHDLCLIDTDGSSPETCLGLAGQINAVALTPDGQLLSVVLLDDAGKPENIIRIIDTNGELPPREFTVQAPALDAGTIAVVQFADAMDFTADSRFLIFDALNTLQLSDGGQLDAWSIYALDLTTGETLMLVPPLPGFDFGFPALSQTHDHFITFDAFEQAARQSHIMAGNLNTGSLSEVAVVNGNFAVPGYTGDDTAIVYAQTDATTATGLSLFRQPLAEDHMTPSGSPTLWLSDANFGVVYRRGTFSTPQDGHILVSLETQPAGIRQSFEFNPSYGDIFTLSAGQTADSGPLLPTSPSSPYAVLEVNLPDGWHVTHARCDNDSNPSAITLDPGETVTCTFVNTFDGVLQPGDVNGDGTRTPADALLIFRFFLGLSALDSDQQELADVNGDGSPTSADALCIFRSFLGLPSCLDAGTAAGTMTSANP